MLTLSTTNDTSGHRQTVMHNVGCALVPYVSYSDGIPNDCSDEMPDDTAFNFLIRRQQTDLLSGNSTARRCERKQQNELLCRQSQKEFSERDRLARRMRVVSWEMHPTKFSMRKRGQSWACPGVDVINVERTYNSLCLNSNRETVRQHRGLQ